MAGILLTQAAAGGDGSLPGGVGGDAGGGGGGGSRGNSGDGSGVCAGAGGGSGTVTNGGNAIGVSGGAGGLRCGASGGDSFEDGAHASCPGGGGGGGGNPDRYRFGSLSGGKGGNGSPDATNIAVGTLRLRAERADAGDGRVYPIVVRGADALCNTGFSCGSVVVSHNASPSSLASVNSQAEAARAYCHANNGAAPPGYFVIGDGAVIGPKQ